MAKKVFLLIIAAALGAVIMTTSIYVYHINPVVVWTLLFVCWACYRLKMRADTLFSKQQPVETEGGLGEASPSDSAAHPLLERGSAGGSRS